MMLRSIWRIHQQLRSVWSNIFLPLGPYFIFGPKIVFPLDPRAMKPLLALLLKTDNRYSLCFNKTYSKLQITIVYARM
jgi:hypothetical protein